MSIKDRVEFTCPSCSAQHDRGYVDGMSVFRCLRCGYMGYGHHPDPEIDAGIQADVLEGRRADQAVLRANPEMVNDPLWADVEMPL